MLSRLLSATRFFQLKRRRRRWSKFRPPVFRENRLALRHVEFGYEEFLVESAIFNVYEGAGGVWEFVVKVEAGEVTHPSELQEIATGRPCFEATALLPVDDTTLVAGRVVRQAEGYDHLRGQNLSTFFYLTHNNVEELEVEVLTVKTSSLKARVTGSCVVNGSLLVHPDARFSVEAEFLRSPELRRGIQ